MKKYNMLLGAVLVLSVCLSVIAAIHLNRNSKNANSLYTIEINRLCDKLVSGGSYVPPDLSECDYVDSVEFLPAEHVTDESMMASFFHKKNQRAYQIEPLYEKDKLIGYVKFEYEAKQFNKSLLIAIECVLAVITIGMLSVLIYIRQTILVPFHNYSRLPIAMANGHFKNEILESKNKFFGNFLWGLALLQDRLDASKRKVYQLEREKKLMLLSLSHDTKTPLNNIKLYTQALSEGLYESEEQKKKAYQQIHEKAASIESYVSEIMKSSQENILNIEVKQGEFYIKDLVSEIERTYKKRCELNHMEFRIGTYENKLLKGDMDRTCEVIENIIENAFKYGDGRFIEITFYEEDYCQLIQIHNSGTPVANQEFNHIFDSFYRGANSEGKEGYGLGLYICHQIMIQMEGDIFAKTCEDGMDFCLVFEE